MKTTLITFLIAASLVACGGKSKKSTTPGGSQTEINGNGSATGGATYGGTMKPAGGAGADPCAMPK